MVDRITKVGKKDVGFVFSNCHFILVLLGDGKRVSDVE